MERAWWENLVRVLARPRAVFAAFRDDSDDARDARSEPITVVALLAGVSTVSWAPETGRLLNDPAIDSVLVAVLLFLTGALYGIAGYFAFGALTRLGLATVGASADRRTVRHLTAYAAAPLALSIVLLPVRLAIWGRDVFERGEESGSEVLGALFLGSLAWSVALLALGLATALRLDWRRATAAVLLPAFVPAVAVAAVLT